MKLAPTHDEITLEADGTVVGFQLGVPNATPVVAAPGPPNPMDRIDTLTTEQGQQAAARAEQARLEGIRVAGAKLGYLPPRSEAERAYPASWLPELSRRPS
jgi:hypothetical protein